MIANIKLKNNTSLIVTATKIGVIQTPYQNKIELLYLYFDFQISRKN
jgi:hypothetical protein